MLIKLPHLLTAAGLLLATPALANLPSPDSDCQDGSECDPCTIPSYCSPGETGVCITECDDGDDDSAGDEDCYLRCETDPTFQDEGVCADVDNPACSAGPIVGAGSAAGLVVLVALGAVLRARRR